MKKFFEEFKKFAFKGNVVDLAVAVVIGAAFNAIVNSLVKDIISPLVGLIFNTDFSHLSFTVRDVAIPYGSFIMAVVDFLIVAFTLFVVVKAMNKASNITKKPEAPKEPTTKKCPYCLSEINIKATRCPHCTSQIDE